MTDRILKLIRKVTGAQAIVRIEVVQRLWSGYGEIVRYGLIGSDRSSVIVKQVQLPAQGRRLQKTDSGLSHRRKIRSYQAEVAWYGRWSSSCGDLLPVERSRSTRQRYEWQNAGAKS